MMPELPGGVNRRRARSSGRRSGATVRFRCDPVMLAGELVDRRGVGLVELEQPAPRGRHDRARKRIVAAPRADDELVPPADATRVLGPDELLEGADTVGIEPLGVVPDHDSAVLE